MLIWNAHSRMIDALAFGPDGHTLALSGYHLACRVIDPLTGERRWTAGSNSAFGLSLAFAPGGAVLCRQSGLSVRDPATGDETHRFGDWCQSFALAPDGRTAFAASKRYNTVARYVLGTNAPPDEFQLDTGLTNRLAVAPNGALLAAVGGRRFCLVTTDTFEVRAGSGHRALSSGAFALAFSPCGRFLAFSAGRTLFAWDVPDMREVAQKHLESKHFMDAAFTPDGRRLLTVSKEGAVRVWDTATWACEHTLEWGVGPLRAVAIAPDGTRAAAAGDSGRVVVWDLDV
ncbi:MAG TPA: WD40 repeat domain-containing protein [Gemmata sp.]